jgi:hypothetical protein
MNSYNRGKKVRTRWSIASSARLAQKSSARIPIATLKKELRCRIDIDPLSLRLFRQSQTGFGGRKKLANSGVALHGNGRRKAPSSEAESDVLGGYCEGIRGAATDSATKFRRAAAQSGMNSRIRRSMARAGGRGWSFRILPKCQIGMGAQKIFSKRSLLSFTF